jgi:DNA-binding MarR family transcriptional regulator
MNESLELARRLLRVIDVITKFSEQRMPEEFAQLRLTQVRILHLLLHRPGISQKSLAKLLQITPAAISVTVRDLEADGLIERNPDPEDARQMKLVLSERGEALVTSGEDMRYGAVAKMLEALSIEDQRMIVEALERAFEITQNGNGDH